MYHLNYKLIEKLPSILRIPKKEFARRCGVQYPTFQKWTAGEISCESLVRICNLFRVSLSSFITLEENPVITDRETDYVISEDRWAPVEWRNEEILSLFGEKGITGIPKTQASSMLGFASNQIFDHWAKSPSATKMKDLLNMLNTFQLDASYMFSDPNSLIPAPNWQIGDRHIADILEERLSGFKEMARREAERERDYRTVVAERDRLQRELRMLRMKRDGTQTGSLDSPFKNSGYTFHSELWESLPELFDMPRREFCEAVGINYSKLKETRNVPVPSVVAACNLLRMSISHFFVPKNEAAPVQDRAFYQISPRLFVPIENCMWRINFLFGRYSALDYSIERTGLSYTGFRSLQSDKETSRVLTLCDVCSQFNISPGVFFNDGNRRKAAYLQSQNERLLLNAIEVMMENEKLRETVRRLKEKQDAVE